jgi:hypothetical protein
VSPLVTPGVHPRCYQGGHLQAFEVFLESAAGDAQAPGDFPLGDALLEERAQLLAIDITAHGPPPRRKHSTTSA